MSVSVQLENEISENAFDDLERRLQEDFNAIMNPGKETDSGIGSPQKKLCNNTKIPVVNHVDTVSNSEEVSTPSQDAKSLYIGDLENDVTEAQLFELFSAVSFVKSVKICLQKQTKKPLGYGYINFYQREEAEKALKELNFTKINDRKCRLMFKDPVASQINSREDVAKCNLVVKNLDKDVDSKYLHDTFSLLGKIISCKVGTDDENESLGYGFVHFANEEDAEKAIKTLNGITLLSKPIKIEKYHTSDELLQIRENTYTNIYVKNYPRHHTVADIRQQLSQYGEIKSLRAPKHMDGLLLGFFYCDFKTHESAVKAVHALNGKPLDNKAGAIVAMRHLSVNERRQYNAKK